MRVSWALQHQGQRPEKYMAFHAAKTLRPNSKIIRQKEQLDIQASMQTLPELGSNSYAVHLDKSMDRCWREMLMSASEIRIIGSCRVPLDDEG